MDMLSFVLSMIGFGEEIPHDDRKSEKVASVDKPEDGLHNAKVEVAGGKEKVAGDSGQT